MSFVFNCGMNCGSSSCLFCGGGFVVFCLMLVAAPIDCVTLCWAIVLSASDCVLTGYVLVELRK